MRTYFKLLTASFFFALFFAGTVSAQTVLNSKLNCPSSHCTSKDLSVVKVFVDAPPCATCSAGNTVSGTLKMTIHNGTKSVRTSFALYGTLSAGAVIGGVSGNIFVCVGPITVKSSDVTPDGVGNQTFTIGTITFSCGQDLTLSNNFLAWTDASGTTTDRCTTFSNATQCSDIEPKCGTAPSITIVQPLSAQISATASCTNSDNGSITITPHGGTPPYEVTIDGTKTTGVTTSATKSPLGDGTYSWLVKDAAGCTISGTQEVTGVAPPTVFTLTGGAVCSSSPNAGTVTLSNSQTGVSYQLQNATNTNVQSAQSGTGSLLTWTGLAAGTYHVVATGAAPTSCTSTAGPANVTVAPNPTVFNPTGSSICASAPGTGAVTTSSSQTDVSYQLKDAANNDVQSAKAGTGSGLTWTSLPGGTYHIVATGAGPTNCTSITGPADVTVVANPTVFNLTGSAICSAAPGTGSVTLSGSQTGVSYQLKDNGNANVQSAKTGSTGNSLTWTSLDAGTYHVVATGAAPTNCTSTTGSATVTVNQNPVAPSAHVVTPLCTDNSLTVQLDGAQSGITYSLTQPGNNTPFSPDGTGKFTGLAFGVGYTVTATDNTTTCASTPLTCGNSSLVSGSQQSSISVQSKKPQVTAAPNPYNDRIRFSFQSPVAGKGSLELYTLMGQKVATVFQGYVQKGQVQTISYNVPANQRTNLIYVFRIGDQKISSMLIGSK